jgi:hypothetical protein
MTSGQQTLVALKWNAERFAAKGKLFLINLISNFTLSFRSGTTESKQRCQRERMLSVIMAANLTT